MKKEKQRYKEVKKYNKKNEKKFLLKETTVLHKHADNKKQTTTDNRCVFPLRVITQVQNNTRSTYEL